MGVSTDALLLFGINLSEVEGCEEGDLLPIFKKLGIEVPKYEEEYELEEYLNEKLKGFELVLTGHIDACRQFFLCPKDTALRARRGYPEAVEKLPVIPEAVEQKLYMIGLKLGLKSGYWLVSYADF
jgi:hypothetical protein